MIWIRRIACRPWCISQREAQKSSLLAYRVCISHTMKQRRTRRGKPSSAKRIAVWKERANRAYAQWSVVEIEMGVLVKSSRMTAAIQLYQDRLPQLCERSKSSTEPWLQALWRRLMIQHASRVLSVIIKLPHDIVVWMNTGCAQTDTRSIYQAFPTATTTATRSMHSCLAILVQEHGYLFLTSFLIYL